MNFTDEHKNVIRLSRDGDLLQLEFFKADNTAPISTIRLRGKESNEVIHQIILAGQL